MKVPHGNVLLKPTTLRYEDLRKKLENLKACHFNGYVQVDLPEVSYQIFFQDGGILTVTEGNGSVPSLSSELLFFYRALDLSSLVSSYVLARDAVQILSNCFTFQEKYLNYQVQGKEFQRLLRLLDSEKMTGLIEINQTGAGEPAYLILNEGKIVTDALLDLYGPILMGMDKITEMMDSLSEGGGVINVYGEVPELIEKKKAVGLEELNLYRCLSVAVESGRFLFGEGNVVRVEEEILREWSRDRQIQKIEILTHQDSPQPFKVVGKRGLGDKISVPSSIQKKLGVAKDEQVLVRPFSYP